MQDESKGKVVMAIAMILMAMAFLHAALSR